MGYWILIIYIYRDEELSYESDILLYCYIILNNAT